jgi:hypothetical protein
MMQESETMEFVYVGDEDTETTLATPNSIVSVTPQSDALYKSSTPIDIPHNGRFRRSESYDNQLMMEKVVAMEDTMGTMSTDFEKVIEATGKLESSVGQLAQTMKDSLEQLKSGFELLKGEFKSMKGDLDCQFLSSSDGALGFGSIQECIQETHHEYKEELKECRQEVTVCHRQVEECKQEVTKCRQEITDFQNISIDTQSVYNQGVESIIKKMMVMQDALLKKIECVPGVKEFQILEKRIEQLEGENTKIKRELYACQSIELNQHLRKGEPVPFKAEKWFGGKSPHALSMLRSMNSEKL